MNTGNLFVALATLLIASAMAETPEYSPTEAAEHIGETATVTDKVERANQAKGGNIFPNMGDAHPNETFTVFIPADAAAKFADFKKYEGMTVSVTGGITAHGASPRLRSTRPTRSP